MNHSDRHQGDVDHSNTFQATVRLCDGRHPLVREASLRLSSAEAVLVEGGLERSYPLGMLAVSPRIGSAPRFVALPDGGELECADAAWLDSLAQQEASEGPVAWLERRWWAALTAVGIVALSLMLVYFFALDALSDKLVQAIPIARERAFGEQSLRSLDKVLLRPSKLSTERTQGIQQGFSGFCTGIPEGPSLRLEFRDSHVVGANAFTLPGGIIIVTDQLVELMPSDDEVLAVLAHELGHTHYRHVLRQGVKSSGTAIIAGAVMGDASSSGGWYRDRIGLAGDPILARFRASGRRLRRRPAAKKRAVASPVCGRAGRAGRRAEAQGNRARLFVLVDAPRLS